MCSIEAQRASMLVHISGDAFVLCTSKILKIQNFPFYVKISDFWKLHFKSTFNYLIENLSGSIISCRNLLIYNNTTAAIVFHVSFFGACRLVLQLLSLKITATKIWGNVLHHLSLSLLQFLVDLVFLRRFQLSILVPHKSLSFLCFSAGIELGMTLLRLLEIER